MKTAVAIILIIMGTLLVALPFVFDVIHQQNLVTLIGRNAVNTSINLPNPMEGINRLAYWLIGSLMVLIGVICSLRPAARCSTSGSSGTAA